MVSQPFGCVSSRRDVSVVLFFYSIIIFGEKTHERETTVDALRALLTWNLLRRV